MKYQLICIDNDLSHLPISDRVVPFPIVDESFVAEVAGAVWIAKYPLDIAMVVEVDECLKSG